LLRLKKKKLFVTFVDFEKAFDKVWRGSLWCKLQHLILSAILL
jgi:hypothetical protein